MKNLFAPWRTKYVTDTGESKKESANEQDCVFCSQLKENKDKQYFILKRCTHSFVMLNKYPYNAGHLLILPIKHVAQLSDLSKEERTELMELQNKSIEILFTTLKNHGLNAGFNLGKAAGAGIPSHLHIHLLPRWEGDTNFMPAIAQTKVISFDLNELYKKLKKEFDQLEI